MLNDILKELFECDWCHKECQTDKAFGNNDDDYAFCSEKCQYEASSYADYQAEMREDR